MPEPVSTALQNDFVAMRKAKQLVSPDDFAHLLTLTRLHAASLLATQIDESHYARAKAIEALRMERCLTAGGVEV